MEGAIHWQGSHITTTTHVGSHVDSPLHVAEGAPTIGDIELERVIGPAVVLDLTPVEANQAIDEHVLAPYLDRDPARRYRDPAHRLDRSCVGHGCLLG